MSTRSPRFGGVLREGYEYDFSVMDPAVGAHVDPSWGAVYETDTLLDPAGRIGPMLVTGWTQDDDLTWRFDVRPGARFHSGAPCDAAAIAAAHNSHRDPSMPLDNVFFWQPVSEVFAEAGQLVIKLHRPWAGLPRNLRSWHSAVHNEAARAAAGDDWGHTVVDGTGPFVHVSTERGLVQRVKRWDDYGGSAATWFENGGPAYLDGVEWIPFLDSAERARALEEGEVHAIQNPDLLDVDRLSEHPDLELIEYQQMSLAYFAVDHQTPPFDDVRVRQAISHALDRRAIVASDLGGHGWPAYGIVPSESHWHAPEVLGFNAYDPKRSEQLLDEAGLPRGEDGVRLEVTVPVVQDSTLRRVSKTVQRMLANVGIRIHLDFMDEFEPFYDMLRAHPPAYMCKWLWPDPLDATVGYVWSRCHEGPNWQRCASPAIDAACETFFSAIDADEERRAARELQVVAAEHLPFVPLYFPATVWAHHKSVHGWRPTATNLYAFYNDVWLEE